MLVHHRDYLSFVGVCLHISLFASFCSFLFQFKIVISVFVFGVKAWITSVCFCCLCISAVLSSCPCLLRSLCLYVFMPVFRYVVMFWFFASVVLCLYVIYLFLIPLVLFFFSVAISVSLPASERPDSPTSQHGKCKHVQFRSLGK